MMRLLVSLMFLISLPQHDAAAAETQARMLFDFETAESARQFQIVNDGVMGGRSSGQHRVRGGILEFSGNLSLANNGGFASVRSSRKSLQLQRGDVVRMRVRGDGREYSLNLYTPDRRTAFSYRAKFRTKADEWIEVDFPLDKFQATSFGRSIRNRPLQPDRASGIGIVLGDKNPGRFRIEVDWVKVMRPTDE